MADERRQEREAKRRARELERQAKEQERLSVQERARLEVERYESHIELLLSLHKECGEPWDWGAISARLCPAAPPKLWRHEHRARQILAWAVDPLEREKKAKLIEEARLLDERELKSDLEPYDAEKQLWAELQSFARRIRARDHTAYGEALYGCRVLSEILDRASYCRFTAHSHDLLECSLLVKGSNAIPSEIKSLSASGKLTSKAMPKPRFHEVYQDYVCGCVLRVAREVFAFLPIRVLLITAIADLFNPATGRTEESPVISTFVLRSVIERLDFDRLDPSAAVESFQHRGDFKATRRSGAFLPITPFSPEELVLEGAPTTDLTELLSRAKKLRLEIEEDLGELSPTPVAGGD